MKDSFNLHVLSSSPSLGTSSESLETETACFSEMLVYPELRPIVRTSNLIWLLTYFVSLCRSFMRRFPSAISLNDAGALVEYCYAARRARKGATVKPLCPVCPSPYKQGSLLNCHTPNIKCKKYAFT